jgi:DNA-binding CsgD family transcriptional regulator
MTRLSDLVITPLTPTERRVLEQISLGRDPGTGSANLTMARSTFNRHSTQIGMKLQVKKSTLKVQMGFASGQLPLPEVLTAPVEFEERDRLLWRALALHSTAVDIAMHAKVEQFDLSGNADRLAKKAGADNEPHLIRLGHAYGVLTTADVPLPCGA